MVFDSKINDGLVQEINRICGSTVATYPNKAKASRLNGALDWYLTLAFAADRRWNFDDINQTSPPIETQDIVSGTSRYKLSDFASKIHQLLKLEILDQDGEAHPLIPQTIDEIGIETFNHEYVNASRVSGLPTHYVKYGDFIYLKANPDYSETGGLIAYFNRPASKFTFVTCTVTIASPGVFSATAHGLVAGDTVIFNTDGALPTGLTADTTYYVIATGLTADAFQVSTTLAGSAVNTSGSQSGNHSFLKTNKEPGIPEIHHEYLARHASVPFLIEKNLPQLNAVIGQRELDARAITEHFSKRDRDVTPGITNEPICYE